MKTYKRQFKTRIDLDLYTRYAEEVISGIENDTINVFRPDDEHALDDVQNEDGASLLDARAMLAVSIREWLPIVCQFIRWKCGCDVAASGRDGHDNAAAYYGSNACEVLWPIEGFDPAGPGALIAGIVLRREKCVDDAAMGDPSESDGLKFVLAHELLHAFHAMRFVVPAFMDWPTFWQEVLNEGGCCDLLVNNHNLRTKFIDRYASENELAEVLSYWPSQGKRWFDAWYSSSSQGSS